MLLFLNQNYTFTLTAVFCAGLATDIDEMLKQIPQIKLNVLNKILEFTSD